MQSKLCECCGKIFEYKVSRRPNARFCSLSCLSKLTKKEQDQKRALEWKNETKEKYISDMRNKFEKFVIKKDGCWDWNGSKNKQGYGAMLHRHKVWKSHRASYLIHKGEIPDKSFVLHSCDNTSCSNPNHLFLGSQFDNMKDMVIKKRGKFRNKLTLDQVKEIKNLLSIGVTMSRIARDYNVSDVCISYIKHNKTWKNIL